jgi:hypothetical protein
MRRCSQHPTYNFIALLLKTIFVKDVTRLKKVELRNKAYAVRIADSSLASCGVLKD